MARLLAPPLEPGCPWSGWTPPNVDWCEHELCSWVVNPADTWSNLAFIVLGLWMWRAARSSGRTDLALFGPASLVTGLFSGIYHASYTYFFQFFDFVGMFVFCFVVITRNACRLQWIGQARQTSFYLAGVAVMSMLVPIVFETGVPIQGLIVVLIVLMLGQEATLSRGAARAANYATYGAALALLAAAGAFSAADVTRLWCDPHNHWLQGHAIWHLLSASSLAALYLFYEALPAGARGDGAPAAR